MTGPGARIRDNVLALGVALDLWDSRDDDGTDRAAARRAATRAVEAIDAALRDLHALRSDLEVEILQDDDATAARIDALLNRCRKGASDD